MPIHRNFARTGEGYLSSLGLPESDRYFDVFGYVARASSENRNRECLFAEVAPDECGNYHFYFGTDYIDGIEPSEYINEWVRLGDELAIEGDRIYHQGFLLGSVPKYIEDMAKNLAPAMKITVEKTNDHPYRFNQVLCHVEVNGKLGTPFSSSYYQPIVDISPYLK